MYLNNKKKPSLIHDSHSRRPIAQLADPELSRSQRIRRRKRSRRPATGYGAGSTGQNAIAGRRIHFAAKQCGRHNHLLVLSLPTAGLRSVQCPSDDHAEAERIVQIGVDPAEAQSFADVR